MPKRKRGHNDAANDEDKGQRIPSKSGGEVWSKSKKKRMRKKAAQGKNNPRTATGEGATQQPRKKAKPQADLRQFSEKGRFSALQQSFLARLSGSRFRELNEELYTTASSSAYKKFSSNPELYEQYHDGFRHQVESWPVNPLNIIVKWLQSTQNNSKNNKRTVADFGCGDAELAKQLLGHKPGAFEIHSFDLVACCDLVTACDMSNVPLGDGTVDVAVFCLSLMGTNLADFIREAHRVLKSSGILKIAEVRSRFESTANRDELEDFIQVLRRLGFHCTKKDRSNKMFVMLELEKNGKKPDKKLEFSAKPCIYKRR